MVQTGFSKKSSVERCLGAKVALLAVIALGGLGLGAGRGEEQTGAARSSQEQPRRDRRAQESSGTLLGQPRVTQDTSKLTLSARSA